MKKLVLEGELLLMVQPEIPKANQTPVWKVLKTSVNNGRISRNKSLKWFELIPDFWLKHQQYFQKRSALNASKLLGDQPQQLATLLQVYQCTMSLVWLQVGIVHHSHHAPKPEDNNPPKKAKDSCRTSKFWTSMDFGDKLFQIYVVEFRIFFGVFLKDAH